MIFSYLFEAKSIQDYLFKTGKLKDVIATSERLDLLIDDNNNSLLYKVLQQANLHSNLITTNFDASADSIHFIRCKGGAFYCYSSTKAALLQLRSLWTLSIQQLFPGLVFTDALVEAETLQEAITKGHQQLANDRNIPTVKFPVATAVTARYSLTGEASVPFSQAATFETKDATSAGIDIDSNLHRQAYHNLNMSIGAALQDKFTPIKLQVKKGEPRKVYYPIDLENDFKFVAQHANNRQEKEAIKDMALIHIDGNGLGLLLHALQSNLQQVSAEEYALAFREFSQALAQATQQAAQTTSAWLYETAKYTLPNSNKEYLPIRPLVLGGDDITLLCRADLALDYSKKFCCAFKESSMQALQKLHQKHLVNTQVKPYLTASGGILFHKACHPFTHSHQLVEGLCVKAKTLTKKIDPNVGPAALAFFRLSNAAVADIDSLCELSQIFRIKDKSTVLTMNLGVNAYVVDPKEHPQNLEQLAQCIQLSQRTTVSMSKWRQITTELALGNKVEADRIYKRAVELGDKKGCIQQQQCFAKVADINSNSDNFKQWYWFNQTSTDGTEQVTQHSQVQTIIADMLIVDHFSLANKGQA